VRVATLLLKGEIRWNVRPGDPAMLPLATLQGCKLVNPLLFSGALDRPQIIPLTAECCHVLSNRLRLVVPRGKGSPEAISAAAHSFLRTLRIVSKQATLPTEFFGVQMAQVAALPELRFPGAPATKGYLRGTYRVETAATMTLVERIEQADVASETPVCHEILLDALRACETRNAREAIVYAALAVETLVRSVLDAEYRRVLAAPSPPAHLNLTSLNVVPLGKGKRSSSPRTDPVYEVLARENTLPRLLHEAPLYLMRRSLAQENAELYRRAIALDRTRQRLSHGRADEFRDEELFALDHEGALRSLAVALELFDWFEIRGYVLPRMDQVPFGGAADDTVIIEVS
jgi:hypothetical protein